MKDSHHSDATAHIELACDEGYLKLNCDAASFAHIKEIIGEEFNLTELTDVPLDKVDRIRITGSYQPNATSADAPAATPPRLQLKHLVSLAFWLGVLVVILLALGLGLYQIAAWIMGLLGN